MPTNFNLTRRDRLLRTVLACTAVLLLGILAMPVASQGNDPTPTLSPGPSSTPDVAAIDPATVEATATGDSAAGITPTADDTINTTDTTDTADTITLTPTTASLDTPSVTPTPTALLELAGEVAFQNRAGQSIAIEITIRDAAGSVIGSTLTDADGHYTLSVPAGDFYWIEADAPFHRPTQLQIMPGIDIPQIVLLGGDLNDDGCVGPSDLAILIEEATLDEDAPIEAAPAEADPDATPEEAAPAGPVGADITGDGLVNGSDLAILSGNYEPGCEAPVEPESTVTPTPTATETPEETPEDSDITPTPSAEPVLIAALPFYDSFSTDQAWLPVGAWQFDTQTAYSGSGWFADSTQRGHISTLEYAGWFDLSGLERLTLTFWQGSLLADADVVTVEISLDNGATWNTIDQQVGLRTDWAAHTIDLEAYRDQVVKLRFRIDTTAELAPETSTLGYWLDDITIDQAESLATPTSTPTAITPDSTLTPTPDELTATPDSTLTTLTPTPDALTVTPDSTATADATATATETPDLVPAATSTTTPTPQPLTLPVYEAMDSEAGWSVLGAWRVDAPGDPQRVSWFADSSPRGQSSILTYQYPVHLATVFNPAISFWQKTSLAPGDTMALDLSPDAGLSWITVYQQGGLTADWTRVEIDLSLYRGQTIWLRFRVTTASQLPENTTSTGCWLDELGIYDIQPVPTALPPTSTPMPTATETPLPSPTATLVPSPTMTDTPLPSWTPTAVPTFSPVVEEALPHEAVPEASSTPEVS